jgi:hypothetical protein
VSLTFFGAVYYIIVKRRAKMPDVYDVLEKTLLADIAESEHNPVISALINQTLANTSEPTDFDVWAESTAQTVERSLEAIEAWSLMKRDE